MPQLGTCPSQLEGQPCELPYSLPCCSHGQGTGSLLHQEPLHTLSVGCSSGGKKDPEPSLEASSLFIAR